MRWKAIAERACRQIFPLFPEAQLSWRTWTEYSEVVRTKLITGVLLLGVIGLFLEQTDLEAPVWQLLIAI